MLSLKATVSFQNVKHGALGIDLIFVDASPSLSSVLTELLQRVEAAEGGGGLGELLCVCHADEASGLVGSLSRTAHELRRRPIESKKGAR